MEEAQLEAFRALLQRRLKELMQEASETLEGMGADRALYPDPVDRALLESNRNFQLRLRDRERKLLKKIEEALERIDNGTYGYCVECGEPIDIKRLEARPVTTLCIDCKEEQERLERMEL